MQAVNRSVLYVYVCEGRMENGEFLAITGRPYFFRIDSSGWDEDLDAFLPALLHAAIGLTTWDYELTPFQAYEGWDPATKFYRFVPRIDDKPRNYEAIRRVSAKLMFERLSERPAGAMAHALIEICTR